MANSKGTSEPFRTFTLCVDIPFNRLASTKGTLYVPTPSNLKGIGSRLSSMVPGLSYILHICPAPRVHTLT